MFKKHKPHLDDKTYGNSLDTKDPNHRFYDQLRFHNRKYEISWIARFRAKREMRRRSKSHNRTIKRLERKYGKYE